MNYLKIITVLLLLSNAPVFAQQFRFKTTALTVLEKEKNNEWGKWSKPELTELFVTLDYDKDKIIIYSREIQHYKIMEYLEKEVTKTDEINAYLCKNQIGEPVKIAFMTRLDQKNKPQLYVYFKDFVFCYDIVEVIDEKK
jgi:hypothetical protein